MLSFIGGMIMLKFIIQYLETNKFIFLLWASLSALLAYLAKPDCMPFFAIVPILAYYISAGSVRKSVLSVVFMTAIIVLLFFLVNFKVPIFNMLSRSRAMEFHENPLYFDKSWMNHLGLSFHSLLYYIRLLIWPYPLLYYYGYNMFPMESLINVVPVFSLVLYLAIAVFTGINLKVKNIAAFGFAWYLVNVSMFSNIVIPAVGIVAERYIFNASFGFCIVLAYFLLKFTKVNFESTSKRVSVNSTFIMASVIILLLFTGQTISRNSDWKDSITLLKHDMQYLDNSVKAHEAMGASLMKESNFAKNQAERNQLVNEAVAHYERAIAIHPGFAMGNNNLGAFYSNLYNDCNKAIPYFLKALETDSAFGEAYINLGLCYTKLNKPAEAIKHLQHGVNLEQGRFLVSYTTLIALYFQNGELEQSKRVLAEAVKFFPGSEVPYREMATQYLQKKDTLEAINYFEPALRIKADPQLSNYIVNYFSKRGDSIRAKKFIAPGN
jgi:tetratricopeptide (TPR) repeat protein